MHEAEAALRAVLRLRRLSSLVTQKGLEVSELRYDSEEDDDCYYCYDKMDFSFRHDPEEGSVSGEAQPHAVYTPSQQLI